MARIPSTLAAKAPLFKCPVCDEQITANVTVEIDLGQLQVTAQPGQDIRIGLDVDPKLTRYNVRHDCQGRPEQAEGPAPGPAPLPPAPDAGEDE